VKKEEELEKRITHVLNSVDDCLAVALIEDKLVGYAWVQSYGEHLRSGDITARFNDLFVLPEYRNQKIGSKLFDFIQSWARDKNVKYLQWQAGTNAIPFYEKLGLTGDTVSDLQTHPFYEIEF